MWKIERDREMGQIKTELGIHRDFLKPINTCRVRVKQRDKKRKTGR